MILYPHDMKNLLSIVINCKNDNYHKNFIKRAPQEVVSHEKKKYLDYKNDYKKLKDNLDNLVS